MINTAYAAGNALAAYRARNTQGAAKTSAAGPAYSSPAASDTVDVSSSARELLDRVKNLDVFSLIYPNNDATKKTKSLGEVKNDFLNDFNDFSSFFNQMSGMMGLDSGDTFTMGLDGVGGMTVTGSDAGAAAKLQQGFSENQTLTARFAVMAARAALTDAGMTEPGFADAYAQDPVAAIENNIDALKERLLGFRTTAGGGEMRYSFDRETDAGQAA